MNTQKKNFKVQVARTPEQLELVRKMGSTNRTESMAATEALAAVMARPILQVIEQAPVVSNLFTTVTYNKGTDSSIPLDDYFDIRSRNFLNVWTQSQPGGTAMNFVQGATQLFVQTYPIYSEISMNKNYLAAGKIDHLANHLTRLVQEVLLVQETNAAFILFNSAAGSRIDGNAANTATNNLAVARTATADVFQLDDFNTMLEGYDNVVASWVGGTPVGQMNEITDILGSVKWFAQLRSIAYQPQNTRAGSIGGTETSNTALAAPESVREEIFRNAGLATLFGKNLHKVWEMGVGKSFNTVYGTAIGATALPGFGQGWGGGTTSVFDGTTQEVILGLNTEMPDLIRLRMTDEGSEFSLVADDQFSQRSKKTGLYGELVEGYTSIEGRGKFLMVM